MAKTQMLPMFTGEDRKIRRRTDKLGEEGLRLVNYINDRLDSGAKWVDVAEALATVADAAWAVTFEVVVPGPEDKADFLPMNLSQENR